MFDRGKTIPNGVVAGVTDPGCTRFRHKLQTAPVDIRWENGNAHSFAFANENGNFFRVIDLVAEQTRHKFHRVMRLEIRRLITDHTIGRAVAFVEPVTGEFFQQIENGVRFFLRYLVRPRAALEEISAFLRHFFLVFFAHGAPEKISLCERVAGKFARSSHHLFLINHHAVGVGADVFQ